MGAGNCVVAGQAAFRYSLTSPSQRAVLRTWRCLSGWSGGLEVGPDAVSGDLGSCGGVTAQQPRGGVEPLGAGERAGAGVVSAADLLQGAVEAADGRGAVFDEFAAVVDQALQVIWGIRAAGCGQVVVSGGDAGDLQCVDVVGFGAGAVPVGAQNRVVAGQAACLYSLMRPSQRVVRTSRRGNGWSVVLLSGVVCRGGRWSSERWGRCML